MAELNSFNQLKVLHWKDRIEKIIDGGFPPPVTVEIDPSNNCNHNCPHCFYKEFREGKNRHLPKKTLFNIIEQLILAGVKSITFTGGGEPLANAHTVKALEKYSEHIDFGLVTNGGMLKGHEKIIVKHCKYVRISLDAGCEYAHKKMHCSDDYDRIVESITTLAKLKKELKSEIEIGVTFLLNENNADELEKFVFVASGTGADFAYIRPEIGWEKEFPKDFIPEVKKNLRRCKTYESKRFKLYINIPRINQVVTKEKTFKRCLSTPLISVIGADGNVYLCCQWRGSPLHVIGNIYKQKFKDLWGGKRHREILKWIDVNKCPPCRNGIYNEIFERCIINDGLRQNFL